MNKQNLTSQKTLAYVGRFLTGCTTLEKNCQICGKPGTIRHNKLNPFQVQILCKDCRKELDIGNTTVDEYVIDVPILNLADYVKAPFKYLKNRPFNSEEIEIIKSWLTTDLFITRICSKYNISPETLDMIIHRYAIRDSYYLDRFYKNQRILKSRQISSHATKRGIKNKEATPLQKYKLETGLTTKEICQKCNNEITPLTVNLIAEGKVINPKIKTKEILSKGLGIKIDELFPKKGE